MKSPVIKLWSKNMKEQVRVRVCEELSDFADKVGWGVLDIDNTYERNVT